MTRSGLAAAVVASLIAAGAAWLLVARGSRPSEVRRLWTGDPAGAGSVSLTRGPGLQLELERSTGGWRMTAPRAWPANGQAVDALLERLSKATLSDVLTADPSRHARFGLGEGEALKVSVGGKAPATVFAGKAPAGGDGLFVRADGSPEVREARGLSAWDVDRSTDDWLDRTLARVPSGAAEAVVLRTTQTVALERGAGGAWTLSGVAVSSAPGSALGRVLQELEALEAERIEFGSKPPQAKPVLTLQVRWKEKDSTQRAELRVYPEREGRHPAYRDDLPDVRFILASWRLDALRAGPAAFREPNP